MKIGMVGLGKMGGNMAARLADAGHEVVGHDPHSPASRVASLAEMVQLLDPPRVVWVMVPAGEPTEQVVHDLADLLSGGDVVVDGGNSNWHDSVRRAGVLAERGLGFVDAGTSGGVWGRTEGYCLMVGGEARHVATALPVFEALRPPDGGYVHAGPVGTGHFTKMVHNGIEYGIMEAYAEGYELLARSGLGIDVVGALDAWRSGSVVRSWLLDLLVRAVEQTPDLEGIAGYARDSGEGRWTVEEAVERGVATPVIAAALFARFVSQHDDSIAMKAIAALRNQFGGHAVLAETESAAGDQPVRPPAGGPSA
ncbi:MAG TPA: decarboxylating 6-phosphogluconate dehydrogenase [Acidimicrobiales bacterium]|nr:decarboxylating 6-phosphogluconate dehydrogenase [Acidimicrobiales bacterium]